MQLPDDFRKSYESSESYPRNLVHQGTYLSALQSYKNRLDSAAPKLFAENDTDGDVPFRDLVPAGDVFEKENVLSDAALKERLGDKSTIDPLTSAYVGPLATKKDPKCRFIFIWAGHSRKYLNMTRGMLVRILTYHQVMPGYLDFMSVFGQQTKQRDLRFSGFREQTLLGNPPRGPVVPDLGRSGRQFQLCYNLKSPACSPGAGPLGGTTWSIRQAALHHQFDVVEGTTLWIITKGDLDIKLRIQEMTGKDGRAEDRAFGTPEECFKSSLAVHTLLCHWSTEEWRWYIQWLEDVIDRDTEEYIYAAVLGSREKDKPRHVYTPGDLQAVQSYEDKTNEAIMVLEANVDVLTALRRYYEGLLRHNNFPMKRSCRDDVLTFATQVNDMIYDSKMQISRAKLLVRITADRKSLVLQHLQSQGTEKMEILTENMHQIGVMAQKEAITMRIITAVTLLYLPATFVSTFFSTDVVKYQNQNANRSTSQENQLSNGNFSGLALLRWLEVTLPLTLITLGVGYYFIRRANKKRERLPFFSVGHTRF